MPEARISESSTAAAALLVGKELSVVAGRGRRVGPLDLRLPAGSSWALLGRPGAGKTALIRCLVGLRRPGHGEVSLFGRPATRLTSTMRRRLAYLPQRLPLYDTLTVQQTIRFARAFFADWDDQEADRLRARFELAAAVLIGDLSVADRRRLALLICLSQRCDLFVLDEPLAGIEATARTETLEIVTARAKSLDAALLMSACSPTELPARLATLTILHRGRVALQGRPAEVVATTHELVLPWSETDRAERRHEVGALGGRTLSSWDDSEGHHRIVSGVTAVALEAALGAHGVRPERRSLSLEMIYERCTAGRDTSPGRDA